MKEKIIVSISAICLLIAGCSSQKNREAFLEEYIAVSDEIVRMVDANPTAEGVKQARSYLDSKKASLKSKFAAGKNDGDDKEMQHKFGVIVTGQLRKVGQLSEKHPTVKNEMENLTKDFGDFLLKS